MLPTCQLHLLFLLRCLTLKNNLLTQNWTRSSTFVERCWPLLTPHKGRKLDKSWGKLKKSGTHASGVQWWKCRLYFTYFLLFRTLFQWFWIQLSYALLLDHAFIVEVNSAQLTSQQILYKAVLLIFFYIFLMWWIVCSKQMKGWNKLGVKTSQSKLVFNGVQVPYKVGHLWPRQWIIFSIN